MCIRDRPVTDHAGIVVSVDYDAGTADVMEGNRSNKVKKVTLSLIHI